MIANLLVISKIFSTVVLKIAANCFLHTKTLDIPQNLSNQIVFTVLNAKFKQSSETYSLLKFLQSICSNESHIFNDRVA